MSLTSIASQLATLERVVKKAMAAETALDWLNSYGPKVPQSSGESINASVNQNLASACVGAKEARQYLELAILQQFGEINALAIRMAEADLEAGKTAIPSQEKTCVKL